MAGTGLEAAVVQDEMGKPVMPALTIVDEMAAHVICGAVPMTRGAARHIRLVLHAAWAIHAVAPGQQKREAQRTGCHSF